MHQYIHMSHMTTLWIYWPLDKWRLKQNWTFRPLDTVDLITLDIRDRTSQVNYEPLTPKGKQLIFLKWLIFKNNPKFTSEYLSFILDGWLSENDQFCTVTEPEKESHFRHFQTGDQNYDESCHRMVYYQNQVKF